MIRRSRSKHDAKSLPSPLRHATTVGVPLQVAARMRDTPHLRDFASGARTLTHRIGRSPHTQVNASRSVTRWGSSSTRIVTVRVVQTRSAASRQLTHLAGYSATNGSCVRSACSTCDSCGRTRHRTASSTALLLPMRFSRPTIRPDAHHQGASRERQRARTDPTAEGWPAHSCKRSPGGAPALAVGVIRSRPDLVGPPRVARRWVSTRPRVRSG